MELILLMVAMFAIMYFLMIRPQQKKMKEDMAMRAQLAEGDRVLLTSGIFGTIAHVGERQMIIELAPGVEITVLKGNVARKVLPEDEEFEFTDDAPAVTDADVDAPADALLFDPRESAPVEQAPVEPKPFADEGAVPGYQPWERTGDDEHRAGDSK